MSLILQQRLKKLTILKSRGEYFSGTHFSLAELGCIVSYGKNFDQEFRILRLQCETKMLSLSGQW